MSETYAISTAAADRPALLHRLRPLGPARHGDVAVHQGDLRGRADQVFGEGNMRRDFTYIDDIVTGVVACLDNPPPDDGEEKGGRQQGAAPALQYRQQQFRRADPDDRADRAGCGAKAKSG
jgi:hypothetical protein